MNVDEISKKITDIKPDLLNIEKDIQDAIEITKIKPEISVASLRKLTEKILCEAYERVYNEPPNETMIQKVKNQLLSKGALPRRIRNHVDTIQDFGNMSIHHSLENLEQDDIEMCFSALASIYKWFVDTYAPAVKEKENPAETKNKTMDKSYDKVNHSKEKEQVLTPSKKSPVGKIFLTLFVLSLMGVGVYILLYIYPGFMKDKGQNTAENSDSEGKNDLKSSNVGNGDLGKIKVSSDLTDKIVLSWNSDKELNYSLYRKISSRNDDYKILSKKVTGEYQDKSVVNGIEYTYKIDASKNGKVISSKEISAKTKKKTGAWIDYSSVSEITPPERRNSSIAMINENTFLLFGGKGKDGLLDDLWRYDLNENTWKEIKTSSNPPEREFHDMVYIGNDQVLLFGGKTNRTALSDTWIFNLSKNVWIRHRRLNEDTPLPRAYHKMAFDGKSKVVLFSGAKNTKENYYSDLYQYDINSKKWTAIYESSEDDQASVRGGLKPSARIYHTFDFITDDKFVLLGGYDGKRKLYDTWIFHIEGNRWEKAGTNKKILRNLHATALYSSGKLITVGGYGNNVLNDSWVFNSNDASWTKLDGASLPVGLYCHSIVSSPSKKTSLIFGGVNVGNSLSDKTYIIYHQ